jgi:predicted N-acetyltransferase YhbS
MFQIRTLKKEDFDFAVELANTMDWNMAIEDFKFMASLEPNGCFILTDDSKPVGIATCNAFGEVGWFGNLVVEERYRKRGAGSMLVRHALQYLQENGVKTVGLYAYPNLNSFYGRFGFRHDEDFSFLKAEGVAQIATKPLAMIDDKRLPEVVEFDCKFFGGNRKKLLESIITLSGNLGYYAKDQGEIVGYVAATIYETMAWIGPLICHPARYDVAVSLVKAVLSQLNGKDVYAVVSKKDTQLMDTLLGVGLRESFFVSRMFLGTSIAKNCIYMAESLERG